MKLFEKKRLEQNRRFRIRSKVKGTAERPRLTLCLSNKHAYAQCIDDDLGRTLGALSSLSKNLKTLHLKPNVAGLQELGRLFGNYLKEKGITQVVFDRAGRSYVGCVRVFADAIRETGINF